MRPLLAICILLATGGCAARKPATYTPPPIVDVPVGLPAEMEAALETAGQRLTARGFDVSSQVGLVQAMLADASLRVRYMSVECVGRTGLGGFFVDTLLAPGEDIAGRTSFQDGRPCVQGYSDVQSWPMTVYVRDATVLPHEFLHVLYFLAFPARLCSDGVSPQWALVEHGGDCDPLNSR